MIIINNWFFHIIRFRNKQRKKERKENKLKFDQLSSKAIAAMAPYPAMTPP